MPSIQYSFQRREIKYLLTPSQYAQLLPALKRETEPDGQYAVRNIYYDTPSYDLIRTSVSKPVYKEKFRLRCYGAAGEGLIFAEIKKKYRGVVYKRRAATPPSALLAFLDWDFCLPGQEQIQREIRMFFQTYRPTPKVFIGYEREALCGGDDPALRITFDHELRWRTDELNLLSGNNGRPILDEEWIVMEVKTPFAVPLWLAALLNERNIYPVSFSKYGVCYLRHIAPNFLLEGRLRYA